MPRPRPAPTRDILDVDWPFFGELCRALALRVAQSYDPEVIVGIAKAGVIPAAIIASLLGRDLVTMTIARADDDAAPELRSEVPPGMQGKRILVVDETCDSGDTFRLAVHTLKGARPAEVRTAASFQTGKWLPDFHAFHTEKAIVLPWDREIVEGGELVTRPELREWLGA